jgi:hypothetical protein
MDLFVIVNSNIKIRYTFSVYPLSSVVYSIAEGD